MEFFSSELFEIVLEKIKNSCEEQQKKTIEMAYPGICELVQSANKADVWNFGPDAKEEIKTLRRIVLRYTKENVLKVKLYIREPYAVKYKILQNASM